MVDFSSFHAMLTRHHKRGTKEFHMTVRLKELLVKYAEADEDWEWVALLNRGVFTPPVKGLPPTYSYSGELLKEMFDACSVDESAPQFRPGDGTSGSGSHIDKTSERMREILERERSGG